jgi:DNA-binding FadR family transcriptional regulator
LWAIAGTAQDEAKELTEARRLIETELAGLAAERATAEDLEKIRRHLDLMEVASGDSVKFQTADIGFHLAIAEAAHNRILLNALLLIRNLMQQWIASALLVKGVAEEALDQHRKIFLAIAKRNSESSRQLMRSHLEAMAEQFLKVQSEFVRGDGNVQAKVAAVPGHTNEPEQ